MWIARAAIISAAFLLSACATGPRIVASDVRTTAAQPPGAAVLAGARYRFERGPQAAGQPAPERLEAMAQAALARVGLERDDARARLTVQVSGTVSAYWMDDWGRPQGGPGRLSFGLGMGRGGQGPLESGAVAGEGGIRRRLGRPARGRGPAGLAAGPADAGSGPISLCQCRDQVL